MLSCGNCCNRLVLSLSMMTALGLFLRQSANLRRTSTKIFCDYPVKRSILIRLAERNGIGSHGVNPSSDVMSLLQQERPRNFRADDRTACPECGNPLGLARRAPHLTLGAAYERQTFTCQTCRYQVERNADVQGNPLPAGTNADGTS